MNSEKLTMTKKSGADRFFVSHLVIAASVALLWLDYIWPLPDLLSGIAAGLIVSAAIIVFINRTRDEYTLAIWHGGTAAGFATIIFWLAFYALLAPFETFEFSDARFPSLLSVTAYLFTVAVKKMGGRK